MEAISHLTERYGGFGGGTETNPFLQNVIYCDKKAI